MVDKIVNRDTYFLNSLFSYTKLSTIHIYTSRDTIHIRCYYKYSCSRGDNHCD